MQLVTKSALKSDKLIYIYIPIANANDMCCLFYYHNKYYGDSSKTYKHSTSLIPDVREFMSKLRRMTNGEHKTCLLLIYKSDFSFSVRNKASQSDLPPLVINFASQGAAQRGGGGGGPTPRARYGQHVQGVRCYVSPEKDTQDDKRKLAV